MKAGATQTIPAGATESGLAAIITVVGSQHIALRSFAVEAFDDEVGILLDQPASQTTSTTGNVDIAIEDLIVTASTLPAILAADASLLRIASNRIAMKDVASQWASVY